MSVTDIFQLKLPVAALLLAGLATHASSQTADRSIRYESFYNGPALYHSVHADMSQFRVSAEAQHAPRLTRAWTMIGQSQPTAAITGTFFAFENQQPIADVVVNGRLVAQGQRGSVLAVNRRGEVNIWDTGFGERLDYTDTEHAIRGLVRVVRNGEVAPNPRAQNFTDSRIWGRAARTGAGVTRDNRLVLIATTHSVTLGELGWAMRRMGIHDGVALDGGGSTMLYYRGAMVIPPKRSLNNLLILKERSSHPLDRFEFPETVPPLEPVR